MGKVFKWLLRLAGGLVLLVVLAVALVYYLAAQSLPDYDKTLAVAGITGEVEIVRDNANVPHIFAAEDPDVFFGLGYAHAQDRLWQMTVLRRTAQGRLSEVFGARTVAVDRLLQTLGQSAARQGSVPAGQASTRLSMLAFMCRL